jgi:hypothetical protein
MDPATLFFTRSDFAGVASTRVHRVAKQFKAAVDRSFGGLTLLSVSISGARWTAFRVDGASVRRRYADHYTLHSHLIPAVLLGAAQLRLCSL